VVVIASLGSAWLAARSDDGLVAEDYYKRGLLINRELKRTVASGERELGAIVAFGADGEVRVHMEGLKGTTDSLRLKLAHPTRSANDQVVALTPVGSNDYIGRLLNETPGRWIVILETDDWRLPTTTINGPLTEIRLGAAARIPHG
jgi:hypothetical protein